MNGHNFIMELSTFNCDGMECTACPFCVGDDYTCLCLKLAAEHTEIMIKRGLWKRDEKGMIIRL